MTSATTRTTSDQPVRTEDATHIFKIGQAVRLTGLIGRSSQVEGVFRITGTLPPIGDSLQYRIRNENERHERVTTQENLEPATTLPTPGRDTLAKSTLSDNRRSQAK